MASAIGSFMDEAVERLTNYFGIPDVEKKVRGVILAGEASKDGMEAFKKIIHASLPEYKDRFKFDIDPLTIGAVGAAHRAKQWAIKDPFMKPREPYHDDL